MGGKEMVKMRKLLSFVAITMMSFIGAMEVSNACWAQLTPEDLVNGSEVILLGEIKEKLGKVEVVEKFQEIGWLVKVDYLIKGEVKEHEIIVTTPTEEISTHYILGETGDKILLFINQWEGLEQYQPMSPQGVVHVTYETGIDALSAEKTIPGKEFFEKVSLSPTEGWELDENLADLLKKMSVKAVKGTEVVLETPVVPIKVEEEKSIGPMILSGGAALSALGWGILKLFQR